MGPLSFVESNAELRVKTFEGHFLFVSLALSSSLALSTYRSFLLCFFCFALVIWSSLLCYALARFDMLSVMFCAASSFSLHSLSVASSGYVPGTLLQM